MNEKDRHGSFAFTLQILILLVVFLGVCAVLLETFAAAEKLSRAAGEKNDGIELCRNAAEAFAADGTLQNTVRLLGGSFDGQDTVAQLSFDQTLSPADNGCYCLTAEVTREKTPAGTLASAHFTVTDAVGDFCAELRTERYLPDEKGGGADAA